MRRIVFQRHFTMMCMNNSLTERKSKSKTSAAVANWIAPSKEHFKNMFLQFIRNTGTVIADTYFSHIFSRDCRDPDVRANWSIFDCVIHQIDEHLHDESCVHPCQQQYVSAIYCDVMFCCSSVSFWNTCSETEMVVGPMMWLETLTYLHTSCMEADMMDSGMFSTADTRPVSSAV